MAEQFSRIGVPVFLADVKGDLTGISKAGQMNEKLDARLKKLALPEPKFGGCPATLWDVFGEQGHPVRATISDMGPQLLSRLLNLNDTQEGVLNIAFRIADEQKLLLLDLKDLRAILSFIAENASELTTKYGNVTAQSVGTIQRALLVLENQKGDLFFGEPALDINERARLREAERLVRELKMENEFLKKAAAYFARDPR
jgi:DNA helicase HerA-like ATPase